MTKKLSKQGRKRSNPAVIKAITMNKSNLTPITQEDANMFNTIIQVSNQYGKLRKQKAEYEMVLSSMKDKRKSVAQGKVKSIMLPFGKNKFYPCDDKKVILTELDAEITIIANAVKGVSAQLSQYTEGFIGQGLQIQNWAEGKFSSYKPENTYSKGCNPKKEETILFEGEMDEMYDEKGTVKNPAKQEQLRKAIKTAIDSNACKCKSCKTTQK